MIDLIPRKSAVIRKYTFSHRIDGGVVDHNRTGAVDEGAFLYTEEEAVHDHRCAVIKRASGYNSHAAILKELII